MPVYLNTKENVRESLESMRLTLLSAQAQARSALLGFDAARLVLETLDDTILLMVRIDSDIEQRLSAVDAALGKVDFLEEIGDFQAVHDALRPVMSEMLLPLAVPAGVTLN